MRTFLAPLLRNILPHSLILFFAVSFLSPAKALAHRDYNLELTGTITGLTDSSLNIAGLTINVDTNTVIIDGTGNIVTLLDFLVGDYIEVKADLTSDGSFIATVIKPEDEEDHDNRLNVNANIQAMDSTSIIVSGLQIYVDENTRIKLRHDNITFADLNVGDSVEVNAKLDSAGFFLAQKIEVQSNGYCHGKLETKGFITSKTDSSLMVNGYNFFVDESTIVHTHHHLILFEDLNLGDFVEVKAYYQPDSSLLARDIELENRNKIEITGTINAKDSTSLTVDSTKIFVNDQTVVLLDYHHPIDFSYLSVGTLVKVKATLQPDSSLLAVLIKVDDENKIEFTGTIESVDTSSLVVGGITVFVNNETEIFTEHHHHHISFGDLMVGMSVEVKAYLQPDSSLLALKIEVEGDNDQHIRITAPIDTIFGSTLVVGGVTFETDTNTVIIDSDENPFEFDSLQIGMIVKVKGMLVSTDVYLATKIKVKDFWCGHMDISGTIAAVSSGNVNIGNDVFAFSPSAVLLDASGNAVSKSYFTAGMDVNVRTAKNEQGNEEIVRIKAKNTNEIDLDGTINEVYSNRIMIGNQTVELQGYTFISYLNGDVISSSDLQTGLSVSAQVISGSNEMMKATYITINKNPDVVKSSGTIIEKTNDYVVVSQPQFMVNNATVVLNRNFRLTDYNTLQVGDPVTIWADNSLGTSTALQIKLGNDEATEINGNENGTVNKYSLLQNYPNPFNPSTTIRFTLPEASFVSLKVFNVIGQEVANLVSDNLAEGTYNINFDASNLPSGVYLYRIKANNFTQVHKMLLIK